MQSQRERRPLTATEPLPRLRQDLQIVHKRKGAQTAYTVAESDGRRTFDFELYEVEYAVAKTFDGERSARDVAEELRSQGMVVSVEQVLSFYRELRGMGFMDVAGGGSNDGAGLAEDRNRFVREGQQRLGTGEPDYAEQYFLAALELDGACEAALAGLAEVEAIRAATPAPDDEDEDDGAGERTVVDPELLADAEVEEDEADTPAALAPPTPARHLPPMHTPLPPMHTPLPPDYPTPSRFYASSYGRPQSGGMPPGYTNPGYTNPGYTNPGYTNPGYTNPGYTNPGYTNPGYVDPITGHSGPIPMVAAPAARQTTSMLLVALGASICVVGVLIGYILFSERGDDPGRRAAAAEQPSAPAVAEGSPASAPAAPEPAPTMQVASGEVEAQRDEVARDEEEQAAATVEPPSDGDATPTAATLAISERRHPIVAQVRASGTGAVAKVDASDGARVKRGSRLVTIRAKRRGGQRKVRALRKRVAELEELAAEDAVYKEFLARAKRDLAAAKRSSGFQRSTVDAPAAGVFRVGRIGKHVRKGQQLGTIVDDERWQLSAQTSAAVQADWSCRVELGEHSASCTLDEVEQRGDEHHVLAAVRAEDAPWLADEAQLVLAPADSGAR